MQIDDSQLIQTVVPYIVEGVATVILAGAGFVFQRVYAYLGWKWDDEKWRVVHSAALSEAQRYWASVEPEVAARAKFSISDPVVAGMAQRALNTIPDEVRKLGITPGEMTGLIVAKIGDLQAKSPVNTPQTKVEVPVVASPQT